MLARILPKIRASSLVVSRMLGTSSKLLAEAEAVDMPQELMSDAPLTDEDVDEEVETQQEVKMTKEQLIDRILRVDHAGEYGADRIYAGQHMVLQNTPVSHVIRKMWQQEVHHLNTFERLMHENPMAKKSVLLPFWNVAGFALGAVGAMVGPQTAMAVTVAIEEFIGEHYNNQLRDLLEVDPNERELLKTLKEFRDDELHHLNTAVEFKAEKSPGYKYVRQAVGTGCKACVWIAERY